jgi:hypothetical protein
VEQAREDHLVAGAALLGQARALQQVVGRREAALEEVEQRGLLRHARQPRVVAHEVEPALVGLARHRLARIALARRVDDRLDDDEPVQLLAQRVLGGLGALQCAHGRIIDPPRARCQGIAVLADRALTAPPASRRRCRCWSGTRGELGAPLPVVSKRDRLVAERARAPLLVIAPPFDDFTMNHTPSWSPWSGSGRHTARSARPSPS